MRLPELLPVQPTAPTAATAPTAGLASSGSTGSFGAVRDALGQSLREDVQQFIAQGDSDDGALPASTLNAEARARLAALSGQPAPGSEGVDGSGPLSGSQQAFLAQLTPLAAEASAQLGVAPHVLVAQAALESSWGQRPLRDAQGGDSHNLFGLKAGSAWRGASAENRTTEYADGQPVAEVARFRAYDDPAASFQDLAQLLLKTPRYQGALNTGSDALAYGLGLQRGGYATDPAYAAKLARVAGQLRQSRD